MTISHLQLILPSVLPSMRDALREQRQLPATLQQWLNAGECTRLWQPDELSMARVDPWQQSLLQALPANLRSHGLASAALMLHAEGGPWLPGTCLHVELVHLQAGMDDLRLIWPPPMTVEEQQLLFDSLQPLLAVSGFDLHLSLAGVTGRWYAVHQQVLQLETFSPHADVATRLFDAMPKGPDSGALRRLMTEAQMLLHEHPVNQQRARRGLPGLNALWFWGAAPLQLVEARAAQRLLSNHPYVQGLCEHLHMDCWPVPDTAAALLSVDADELLPVLPETSLQSLETLWLKPVHAALQQGRIRQLDVYLDHWRISLRGGRWQQLKRRLLTRKSIDQNELFN